MFPEMHERGRSISSGMPHAGIGAGVHDIWLIFGSTSLHWRRSVMRCGEAIFPTSIALRPSLLEPPLT